MTSFPKPGWNQKQSRATKRRQDAKVAKSVRDVCVDRDGYCRLSRPGVLVSLVEFVLGPCRGPSEWAHLVRRSQTRGQSAERRHRSSTSLILCRSHHQAEEAHRFRVSGNANGRLLFVNAAGDEYQE